MPIFASKRPDYLRNNPHYSNVTINQHALESLPVDGVPSDIMTVESESDILSENWPSVDDLAINEYQTSFLATLAFPTLFPTGKGDPTNLSLLNDIPLSEKVKHLVKFAEQCNGKWIFQFASHPRFCYWAFNMIQRKRTLQQSGMFLKQNPGEAHLTIDELCKMAAGDNSHAFISKIS